MSAETSLANETHASCSEPQSSSGLPHEGKSLLLSGVDFGFVALLFGVPFLMSGRSVVAEVVLVAAACWTAICWAAYRIRYPEVRWNGTRAELLLVAGLGLGLLQIAHLSPDLIALLSPHIGETLPLWQAGSQQAIPLGEWNQLSLTPTETVSGIVTFLAYGLTFLVAVQRIRHQRDVERFLRWIAIAAAAMATFGLIQYLTSNGKFYWVFENPLTNTDHTPKGTFFNRNHFAQFLAVGAAPLIWLTLRQFGQTGAMDAPSFMSKSKRRLLPREVQTGAGIFLLGTVVFGVLLSLSRGGTVALLLAAMTCLGILYRRKQVSGKLFGGLFAAAMLSGLFLLTYGFEAVSRRLENWESPHRWSIWEANLAALADFPLFGTCIGSQRDVHPMYLDLPFFEREFTHAESSWVQFASESGITGLALIVVAVGTCFFWCVRGLRSTRDPKTIAALAAVSGGLIASCAHSLVDVVWHVPACMIIVVALAACACRLFQLSDQSQPSPQRSAASGNLMPRLSGVATLAGLVVLGSWMMDTKIPALRALPHWHDYLRLTLSTDEDESNANDERTEEEKQFLLRARIAALVPAAKADPRDGRIRLRLAREYLRYFEAAQKTSENALTLAHVRGASLDAGFESQEAQDEWLTRALGKNRKILDIALQTTRRALALSPLQGSGYLYLGDLCFLNMADRDAMKAYLNQALVVRPYAADVLVSAGRDAWMEGESTAAIEYWKRAFERDRYYQRVLIDMLVEFVPATFIFEQFEPDWLALRHLKTRYAELGRPDDYAVVLQKFAEAGEQRARQLKGDDAIRRWVSAQRTYDELGKPDEALRCMQAAFEEFPNSYRIRYALGLACIRQQQFDDASTHLKWCALRKSGDGKLASLIDQVARERIRAMATRPASDRRL